MLMEFLCNSESEVSFCLLKPVWLVKDTYFPLTVFLAETACPLTDVD
jgi:hypothetical protein